jgi:agmatinase
MVAVLGIPFDANSSFLRGAALAPPRIRAMATDGSSNLFSELGLEIREHKTYLDKGDLAFSDTNAQKAFDTIYDGIHQLLQEKHPVLSLGGDHSVTYPIIKAYAQFYPDLHILHIDAHGDLYDNFEENPYSHASPFARIMENGLARSLTQVGIRSLTTHLREQATKFGVQIVEMKDWSMDFMESLQGPLYISLDLDALDPAFAPGVSHHEPGGLSVREVLNIIHRLKVPVVGADIVEYNPTRDWQYQTAMVGYKFFKELIAKMILG